MSRRPSPSSRLAMQQRPHAVHETRLLLTLRIHRGRACRNAAGKPPAAPHAHALAGRLCAGHVELDIRALPQRRRERSEGVTGQGQAPQRAQPRCPPSPHRAHVRQHLGGARRGGGGWRTEAGGEHGEAVVGGGEERQGPQLRHARVQEPAPHPAQCRGPARLGPADSHPHDGAERGHRAATGGRLHRGRDPAAMRGGRGGGGAGGRGGLRWLLSRVRRSRAARSQTHAGSVASALLSSARLRSEPSRPAQSPPVTPQRKQRGERPTRMKRRLGTGRADLGSR